MTVKQGNTPLSPENDEIDLGQLFGALIDARWLIIAITSLFAVIGVAYALLATPIYKADVLMQVEKGAAGASALLGGETGEMFSNEPSSSTEIEIIKSRMILGMTVDNLNLTTRVQPVYLPYVGEGIARLTNNQAKAQVERFQTPEWETQTAFTVVLTSPEQGEFTLYDMEERPILSGTVGQVAKNNGYELFLSQLTGDAGQEYRLTKRSRFGVIQSLQGGLEIAEKGKGTGILEMTFTGSDKEEIKAIINDISQNYFVQNVERSSAEAEKSLEFLDANLPNVKNELIAAEDRFNSFQQQNGSIDLGFEAQTMLQAMVTIDNKLNDLAFKEAELSQRFKKDHVSYQSLLRNRDLLLKEKAKLDEQLQGVPLVQREALRIKRDVDVNQQIYIKLLNKVQELRVVKASTVGNVRILDEAQVYAGAIEPKKPLIVVIATLLGGMLAVGLVLLRTALHKGIQSPEQIEEVGLSVYASVPKSAQQLALSEKIQEKSKRLKKRRHRTAANSDNKGATEQPDLSQFLLAEANPADLAIESLRGLRTNLHFAMLEAKNNILMISGPSPSVGKSFVSANFAAVAAKTGQKVLLIDADMRKGYIQKHFNLDANNGLSDLLSGQIAQEDCIKATAIANLNIVTRGHLPPNPSELLMNSRLKTLLEWASENYDLVIIDTPPILAVTDAGIVGSLCGTSLMVGRFDQNTVKEIEIAYNRFDQAGIEIKGFILNAVEKKASSYYGGYGYYNYSYKSDTK
ncbi:polysaccharide biosynthesis tyrosine autokinase [Marinomonas sp. A79]|uniref:Polysaccharide biosynthesis tyrosine autokinase n=1 Tax=Marinomonas vulgaris TaxID=2823372 RepID=A0ABS5HD41_9GAMM|nr:polysaccharide biosynthesis tyrosine autokinase [Marinomonas vulgaris]MBR7889308.1 polysaccharide biosynthesis tyrosine autokinase [Marinomonas vulgaris]